MVRTKLTRLLKSNELFISPHKPDYNNLPERK